MKIEQVEERYRLCYVHNPKHFISDSFEVESESGRKVLVGKVRHRYFKRFRIVAILKPKR